MYTHNLSNPADIQTCADPVDGIADGTTVGNTYLLRRIFGTLTAFDSNVQEITPSNTACPTWLLPLSGSILGTVAVNSVANGTLRFFFANDVGLTASTSSISANCMVYHWEYNNAMASVNEGVIAPYVMFALSGSAIFASLTSGATNSYMYENNRSVASQMLYQHNYYATVTTTMNNIHRVLFWKSNDMLFMLAVDKNTSGYRGGGAIHIRPQWQGFSQSASATSVSGTIINGDNINAIVQVSNGGGSLFIEGFNRQTSEHNNTYASVPGLTFISSAGGLPNLAFSVSSVVQVITSRLRIGISPTTAPKFIITSDEIDNVLLVESTLYTIGSIQLLNGIYYLIAGFITDGKSSYNMLLQLSG